MQSLVLRWYLMGSKGAFQPMRSTSCVLQMNCWSACKQNRLKCDNTDFKQKPDLGTSVFPLAYKFCSHMQYTSECRDYGSAIDLICCSSIPHLWLLTAPELFLKSRFCWDNLVNKTLNRLKCWNTDRRKTKSQVLRYQSNLQNLLFGPSLHINIAFMTTRTQESQVKIKTLY